MFTFIANIVMDDELSSLPIFRNMRELQEVKIWSKDFDSYKQCVDHAKRFASDIAIGLNTSGSSYQIDPCINPLLSPDDEEADDDAEQGLKGTGPLSDWDNLELARFYMIDPQVKDQTGSFLTKVIVSVFSKPQNIIKGN
jgi:hypothetical protein